MRAMAAIVAQRTGNRSQIYARTPVGDRKLARVPKVKISPVRLTILAARACPTIRGFCAHLDMASPPASFDPQARTPSRNDSDRRTDIGLHRNCIVPAEFSRNRSPKRPPWRPRKRALSVRGTAASRRKSDHNPAETPPERIEAASRTGSGKITGRPRFSSPPRFRRQQSPRRHRWCTSGRAADRR